MKFGINHAHNIKVPRMANCMRLVHYSYNLNHAITNSVEEKTIQNATLMMTKSILLQLWVLKNRIEDAIVQYAA